ncbi:Polypeptide N-acetylgalactosaminyltransferase 6 (Polypeptide GalNAc transferase 6) (GalNAc-T6) (pp-GaNTase 6) (Protein-UDP acetylgalactosaminyltransferase 6) (UDP-GalNAc:polypeptide N-acetylgalactosaminyltransferase 6) [Durusdinium trenchii]|uniref:Polypeptide N-acetylgalactosaminyltransferase n=1 Tax=Durusdinium trenchii TaxID=1381693 RepID=A0ABP0S0C3_9DINO
MPPKSTLPKYTIRVGLIWAVPLGTLLLGCFHWTPLLLALLLTPLEVPKIRTRLFGGRAKKLLPCLKVPALLRLSFLWVLQVWFIILWRANSQDAPSISDTFDEARISVVLPCAGEGLYALNTVRAVYESLPPGLLREIIVVDDGSQPPLSESYLTQEVLDRYGVTLIRHAETVGLIGAKKDGGDAATGEIIVFFDCHVAPQPGWHESFLRLIGENYRRIVTPVITDLDVGTWQQRPGGGGQAKCYLTWDADFKWFESDDPYVPILSGGLLGISKRWWNETGGYDVQMVGWGGENLDQSLRSWLCGGEIMMAKDSFVAHMWRKSDDPRTRAQYTVKAGAANKNRLRAAVAWFGEFSKKLSSFPSLQYDRRNSDGTPWYGDLGNILEVKDRLKCKSFAWFMHRFKHVYEDGGLIPRETFTLKDGSGHCLTYQGEAGTSPNGRGTAALLPCDGGERQRWHGANRLDKGQCCSGLRAWNTDQCLQGVANGKMATFVCDVSGQNPHQAWRFDSGQLKRRGGSNFMQSADCVAIENNKLQVQTCNGAPWRQDEILEPIEFTLYKEAMSSL